ncbi:hypothetical protein [Mycobacterium sp.]|uniref:hypothetical protein n=1 Tax=Mycobacterium sp. TaxID=1785 RepID=UPI003D6B79A2
MRDELDQLLREHYDVSRDDVVAALKTLPILRPWAAQLTAAEAQLLDEVGFSEDPRAYAKAAVDTAAHLGRLINTAFTTNEVAEGLGISSSRVRQRRLDRGLWAIQEGATWLFPLTQFERDANGDPTKQIRGLDRVFQALPADLHPVAVDGFLHAPHPDLQVDGNTMSPLDWLRSGGDIAAVVAVAETTDWYGR